MDKLRLPGLIFLSSLFVLIQKSKTNGSARFTGQRTLTPVV